MWERDGEDHIEGLATRWDANHVYVEIRHENRRQGNGVWVKSGDVYRLAPEPVPRTQRRNKRPGS